MSILGFNVGAKLHKRVISLLINGFAFIVILVLMLTIILTLFSKIAASWFNSDPQFISYAYKSFIYGAFGSVFGGPLMLCSGIF